MDSRDGMQLKDGRGGERKRPAAQRSAEHPGQDGLQRRHEEERVQLKRRRRTRTRRRRRSEQFQFPMF